jgi:hypothetical protein
MKHHSRCLRQWLGSGYAMIGAFLRNRLTVMFDVRRGPCLGDTGNGYRCPRGGAQGVGLEDNTLVPGHEAYWVI